jgi:hypothetical protein
MDQSTDTIDAFSREVLKLASRRELFKRMNEELIRSTILALGHYKVAVADPELVSKLERSLAEWSESKNLYIVLTVMAKIHAEVQAAAEGVSEEEDAGESESESEEDAEEGDEESATKIQANIGRYRELIGSYIGIEEIFGSIRERQFIGSACSAWSKFSSSIGVLLFRVRRSVLTKKRLIDDAAFQLMAYLLSKPTSNPLLRVALFLVWLILTVIAMVLTILLYILRPGKLLELLGLEDDDILLPE